MDYSLLDSGNLKKLEKIGPYKIIRPSNLCIWEPVYKDKWEDVDAIFTRKYGWEFKKKMPSSWNISIENILFKISPTDFGHIGFFKEHSFLFKEIEKMLDGKRKNILNLFAYTGGATFAACKKNAFVCHVDASKPSILWAKENAKLNKAENIRWILDDCLKFLKREERREKKYDGIILDPPTFGRGPSGELFKIERDLFELLVLCKNILNDKGFIVLSCHSPGFTKITLKNILMQIMGENVRCGDMFISSENSFSIPSGSYAIWDNISK